MALRLPSARLVHWVLLNALVVPMTAAAVTWLVLVLAAPDVHGIMAQQIDQVAAALPWSGLALMLVFGAYGGRHKWVWLILGLMVTGQTLMSFLSWVLSFGYISVWLAAHGFPAISPIWGPLLVLLAGLGALGLHLVWFARADRGSVHWGRYSRAGIAVLAVLVALQVAAVLAEHAATRALVEAYGTPATGAALSVPGENAGALPANPLMTPAHIVPPAEMLPAYAVLRTVPFREGGLAALGLFLVTWLAVPWLDRSPAGPVWSRGRSGAVLGMGVLCVLVLGFLGAQPLTDAVLWASRGTAIALAILIWVILPGLGRASGGPPPLRA